MKKLLLVALSALLAIASLAAADDPAAVQTQKNVVLIAAPARYNVMQVLFDVARRYSTVLVSYQGASDGPVLHVWNGFEWLRLQTADYQSGAFLQTYPARVILLGDDELLPAVVRDVSAWCSETRQMTNLETTPLINDIGHYLPFTPADWKWFASRYQMTLVNENAEAAAAAQKESWYDKTAPVTDERPWFFKYFTRDRRAPRSDSAADVPVIHPVEVAPDETVQVAPDETVIWENKE